MKLTSILIASLLTGCATVNTDSTLYSTYESYRREVTSDNIQTSYAKYFSPELISGKNIANKEVQDQLLFKNGMLRIESHYEDIRGQKGCLTVNGYDKDAMPLSFNIEFTPDNQRWLIRAIDILFVDNVRDFSLKGRCPSDYINQ